MVGSMAAGMPELVLKELRTTGPHMSLGNLKASLQWQTYFNKAILF